MAAYCPTLGPKVKYSDVLGLLPHGKNVGCKQDNFIPILQLGKLSPGEIN